MILCVYSSYCNGNEKVLLVKISMSSQDEIGSLNKLSFYFV